METENNTSNDFVQGFSTNDTFISEGQSLAGQEIPSGNSADFVQSEEPLPQKPKKKRSLLFIIGLGLLFALIGKFAGQYLGKSAAQSILSSNKSSLQTVISTDTELQHTYVCSGTELGSSVYATVYYESSSRVMTAFSLEYVFEKEKGFTVDAINESELEKSFPSFTEKDVSESNKYVFAKFMMSDLKDVNRLKEMVDKGIIETKEKEIKSPMNADYFRLSFISSGWTSADSTELSDLHAK